MRCLKLSLHLIKPLMETVGTNDVLLLATACNEGYPCGLKICVGENHSDTLRNLDTVQRPKHRFKKEKKKV